jgi:hypothetical protein
LSGGSGISGNVPTRAASASITSDVYTVKIEILHLERRIAETHDDPIARYDLLQQTVLLLIGMIEGMASPGHPEGEGPKAIAIKRAKEIRAEILMRPIPIPQQPHYEPYENIGGGMYVIAIDPKEPDSIAQVNDLDRMTAILMRNKLRQLHSQENLWYMVRWSELHGILALHQLWHLGTEFHHEVTVYDRDRQEQGTRHQRDLLEQKRERSGGREDRDQE